MDIFPSISNSSEAYEVLIVSRIQNKQIPKSEKSLEENFGMNFGEGNN